MKLSGFIVGAVMAGALLALLALTRLFNLDPAIVELEVREVEITTLPEPPPPPLEEPPPDAPPPPPSLASVSQVPDPTRVPIPKAEIPLDLETPVDLFFTDVPPAPLPQPQPVRKPIPKKPPAPLVKSRYSIGELDGKPQLIRHGWGTFPASLARKGVTQGTVVFEVGLSERGRVSVRRVISTSHPELVSPARRIAASASFTSPTRNGQRVKAIMRWPITIRR